MTFGQIILGFVALVSFLVGRYYGRITLYEQAINHAHWMDSIAIKTVLVDYNTVNKMFHWRSELIPGYFYYGINFFGVKIGFSRTFVANVPPSPPFKSL